MMWAFAGVALILYIGLGLFAFSLGRSAGDGDRAMSEAFKERAKERASWR